MQDSLHRLVVESIAINISCLELTPLPVHSRLQPAVRQGLSKVRQKYAAALLSMKKSKTACGVDQEVSAASEWVRSNDSKAARRSVVIVPACLHDSCNLLLVLTPILSVELRRFVVRRTVWVWVV
jgi:hypothetical protein